MVKKRKKINKKNRKIKRKKNIYKIEQEGRKIIYKYTKKWTKSENYFNISYCYALFIDTNI